MQTDAIPELVKLKAMKMTGLDRSNTLVNSMLARKARTRGNSSSRRLGPLYGSVIHSPLKPMKQVSGGTDEPVVEEIDDPF